ncbi:ATP-binding protein [uncultured Neptuniibacter sp.]|uniref:ATP-binding protein n=1 Tax=uncultured Neptuniibacter sp. TaxID=502143 RepID=UPI002620D1C2|nr:ATP-binding protein [uncultured Neptuniibacter sp.]
MTKKKRYKGILLPLLIGFQLFSLVGICVSGYIAYEYSSDIEENLFINLFVREDSNLRDWHVAVHSSTPPAQQPYSRLSQQPNALSRIDLASGIYSRLLIVSENDKRYLVGRGYTQASANSVADRYQRSRSNSSIKETLSQDFLIYDVPVKTGKLTVFLPRAPISHLGDFVLNRHWPIIILIAITSILAALFMYLFLKARYSEVESEQKRFEAFAGVASDWFWEIDSEYCYSYLSERFTAVTGTPVTDLLGSAYTQAIPSGVEPADWQTHLEQLKAKNPFTQLVFSKNLDDQVHWFSISGEPAYDPQGQFQGYRGIGKEITQTIQYQQQIIQERDKAEAANKVKSRFLATMSHEIRTPMNGIIGMAKLLDGTALNPDQQRKVSTIINSSKSLMVILNDILDISKLESGRLVLEEKPFNLREMISDLIRLFRQAVDEKELKLIVQIAPDLEQYISTDEVRLRQVLINLISNAIKFTNDGHIQISLKKITTENHQTGICFEVEDSGIGISQNAQQNIFKSFTQADSSITRQFGGTGLGLAITKLIVDLMQGRLGFESTFGVGSRFWFEVPVTIPNTAEIDHQNKQVVQDDASSSSSPQTLSILIVEDNLINQEVVLSLLKRIGYDADLAENGLEAVEKVQHTRYDLIYMDMQMPKMDGLEATRVIRKLPPPIGETPIIALTANILPEDQQRCREAGMQDFIGKPIDPNELQRTLTQWQGKAIQQTVSEP